MTSAELEFIMINEIFAKCIETRKSAHKEYAQRSEGEADYVFANFERQGTDLDIPPMKIWYVYVKKHWDGILSYINGFKLQRESVKGRIIDVIVYLCILYAWVDKKEGKITIEHKPKVVDSPISVHLDDRAGPTY